jgi:LysM repeat protein
VLLGLFAVVALVPHFLPQAAARLKPAPAAKAANSQTVGLLADVSAAVDAKRATAEVVTSGDALLPDSGVVGTIADVVEQPATDQISIYVVRPGDTLSVIASMFNVSVNTIIWANNLKNASDIAPGDVLTILPVTGLRHTVAKGETLASLAKKYGGDVTEVEQFNGLKTGSALTVGQVIIIPNGEETPTATGGGSTKPDYKGYYLRPLAIGVCTQGLHGHNGVDLGAPAGTAVRAAAGGTVIVAGRLGAWNGGYGNYLVVKHANGTETLYAHLSSYKAGVGQKVAQGETIGTVGNTGLSTGNHLHFEVRGAHNPFGTNCRS